MGGDRLSAEAVHDVGEAVGAGVDVRVVDLVRVAGEDDLRALADARDDRLDLERGEVLGLVDDHVLVGDGASADIGQGLDDDGAGSEEVCGAAVLASHVEVAEHFEGVVDGLHPG